MGKAPLVSSSSRDDVIEWSGGPRAATSGDQASVLGRLTVM